MAARGYVPRGVPLLKPVAAVAGARVCRSGLAVTIDGVPGSGWLEMGWPKSYLEYIGSNTLYDQR